MGVLDRITEAASVREWSRTNDALERIADALESLIPPVPVYGPVRQVQASDILQSTTEHTIELDLEREEALRRPPGTLDRETLEILRQSNVRKRNLDKTASTRPDWTDA